jgi:ABC-type transport system involved in Fe-S cluster assembly fused permease/ATPase subunit
MDMPSHVVALLSIQLVERFYDPLSGTVFIDDQPISELNVQEYRKHLALVSQEPVSPSISDYHRPSI